MRVVSLRWAAVVAVLATITPAAEPNWLRTRGAGQLDRLNATLAGTVLDYTSNHGADRRGWSFALGQKRAAYVYLPPGYDGTTKFPVMLLLHGIGQDEKNFLDLVPRLDEAIRCGAMPPLVIAAPDGSILGRQSFVNTGSFYMNSRAGRFEDYLIDDVWRWVKESFAVRPEREARVLAGASMGGGGAYHVGFKHKEEFGQLVGILPALDFRYIDCTGNYFGDFDPYCVGRRTEFPRNQIIGRFFGVVTIRQRRLLDPLVGRRQEGLDAVMSENNPVELLVSRDVRPGEFGLFVGYAGRDEFNLDAAAEHFLHVARQRGIEVTAVKIPDGRHNVATGMRFIPEWARWLSPRLAAYVPPGYTPGGGCSCAVMHAPLVTGSSRPKYLSTRMSGSRLAGW